MRKSREETAETRKKIIGSAACLFRQNGIVATGLAELMHAAGLTQGGFYRHFESKEELVAESCAASFDPIVELLNEALSGGPGGLRDFANGYLSTSHRDEPGSGCPLAALGSELAHQDGRSRGVATDGFLELVTRIESQYPRLEKGQARSKALALMSSLVGAMTLARLVDDPRLSADILQATRDHAARG